MLSLLYHGVKIQQHFVNASCMSLANKTLPTIWLNPGSNLTIFQGTGPALFIFHFSGRNTCQSHLSYRKVLLMTLGLVLLSQKNLAFLKGFHSPPNCGQPVLQVLRNAARALKPNSKRDRRNQILFTNKYVISYKKYFLVTRV